MADFQSTGKGEDRGSSAGDTLALELRGITKRFPGVLANDRVDLEVRAGEIHALLGENGAGKSTLMNVLYGLYKPDEGEISVFGQHVTLSSSADAIGLGIGMVHQHFMLIPVMTVAENIVLGAEPTSGPMLDLESARKRVAELSETYGLGVRVDARVQDIGVGMQQRAEILKALYREARVLILDEPTAVLTPQEVDEFFEVLRELRSRGVSIVLITHKLDEVLQIADRISVLRRGKKVATIEREGATKPGLASLMVGREVLLAVERTPAVPKEPVLVVEDLWVRDQRDLDAVRGLTLTVHGGEILGIAGVDGNGQTELVEALAGMRHPYRGQISVDGRDLTHSSPRKVSRSRVGHIPEDRHRHGLVLPLQPGRELGPARLLPRADRAPALAAPARDGRARQEVHRALRRARRRPLDAGRLALGRQPAEGRAGARDRVGPASVAGRAADARPRRRRDRVRAPRPRRAARRRPRGPARLVRARRDPGPRRPDPRDVRGPDRARAHGRYDRRAGARPRHDGRKRGGGRGRAGARP